MKLIYFLFILSIHVFGQQYGISGYVQDSTNSERLSDVLIKINKESWSRYSNKYGYFFLESDSAIKSITFSYVGYKSKKVEISGYSLKDTNLVISLSPEIFYTQDILVESSPESKTGRNVISISDIKQMPSVGGEADPIKSIQLFAGVLKSIEGGTSFHVRGGDFDQNLILLDGIPVYNINHFFGFLSVFNIDAINQMEFIRAGFEPKYGGKLSSVLNLTMKEGNQDKFEYKGGISLLSSRFLVEGPLANNSSMMISARRTYLDPVISLVNSSANTSNDKLADYYFYDLNAKVKIGISDLSHLYFSTYFGQDNLDYNEPKQEHNEQEKFHLKWGNQTYLLRWNNLWSKRLFSNISAGYTQYNSMASSNSVEFPQMERRPDMASFILKFSADYFNSEKLILNPGYELNCHKIKITKDGKTYNLTEHSIYTDLQFKLKEFRLNAGGRYNILPQMNYISFNPRLNLNYNMLENINLSLSYDHLTQPVHKLSFNNILNPSDLFFPSGSILKPQEAEQISTGLVYHKGSDQYSIHFVLNLFYKKMYNLPTFIYNIDAINEDAILENLTIGSGKAQGFEIETEYRLPHVNFMVNYTYLDSWRKFPHKNNGQPFQPNFDRTHYFNLFSKYHFSKSLSFAATFNFSSGQIINYADQKFNLYGVNPELGNTNTFFDYGQLNDIRSDNLMRLDLSATWQYTKHWDLFATVYNVFGNEYPIFYEYIDSTNEQKFSGFSLGFIPSFGFNFSY